MSLSRLSSRPRWPHRPHRGPLLLAACASLLAGCAPLFAPPASGSEALQPGLPVERTIEKGGAHEYPVVLAAGDFLRVTLEQRGVDLALRLVAPDRRTLLEEADGPGPYNTYATEDLAAVAEASGLHTIRVLAGGRMAPGAGYRLRIEAPRPAQPEDRLRVEAVRANQAATYAMFESGATAMERQLAYREEARRLWHELGEHGREADTMLLLGLLHKARGEAREAAALFRDAAELYAVAGDPAGQARALNETARSSEEVGHTGSALAAYRQSAELARQAGDRHCETLALSNLGVLLNRLGRSHEAVQSLSEALRIARELGWPDLVGNRLVNLGSAYQDLSEMQKAIGLYREALDHPTAQDTAHNNLGDAYGALGDWDAAIEHYRRALDIVQDRSRKAATFNNLAVAYHKSGQPEEAREAYAKALELARAEGHLSVQVWASNNLGFLYDEMGETAAAVAAWKEVPRLAAGREDLEHMALNARASVLRAEGDAGGARALLERVREAARRRGKTGWEAQATLNLARLELEEGNLPAALRHAESAVAIIEKLRNRVLDPDLRALFLASKQSYYEYYIDILMALHRSRPGEGYDARALNASEQARARSLLDLLTEAGADIRQGVEPGLLEREQKLRGEVRARDRHRIALIQEKASPERIAEAEGELEEALRDLDRFEAELRQNSARYAALTQPRPLSVEEIRRRVLGDDALLLEYALGKEKSYLWAVTPTSLHSFELAGRKEIEKEALAYYNAVTARNRLAEGDSPAQADEEAGRAGRALSDLILKDVAPLLAGRTLLVVADGALQYVPFVALPLPSSPREFLGERNVVVNLPSASTLAVLRDELKDREPAPKLLAVIADPVFAKDDPRVTRNARVAAKPETKRGSSALPGLPPRGPAAASLSGAADLASFAPLPFSAEEADGIAGLVAADQLLKAIDFDASFARATSGELASYRYVHFATHGVLDSSHPELSRLVLSQVDASGNPQEGFLRLHDIYNLQLNADMVVLSACQTALGKEVRGEGLVGLTRGFMYAGAERVVASLWSVEDRATAKLMKSFYRYLLRGEMSAAAALRQAQLDLAGKAQFRSPYFWAGFSLQGEWK